jgi:hypothetical protein
VIGALALLPRPDPLVPSAAVAEGSAARRLARRLLQLEDAALARLVGVAAPGLLAVLGAEGELPWVDGIRYLGRDPRAPSLYLPTAIAFAAPLALVERALLAAAPAGAAPLAVLLPPLRLVPLGAARPVERARLTRWLETAH